MHQVNRFHGNTANNNEMERINGEIRDREKTMRRLKIKEASILKGMQVYHNYIESVVKVSLILQMG